MLAVDDGADAVLPSLVLALDQAVGAYWCDYHAPYSGGLLQLLGLGCSEWMIILASLLSS